MNGMKKGETLGTRISALPGTSRITAASAKPRQKFESSRVGKKTQRLVVFPEAEVETDPSRRVAEEEPWDELRFLPSEQRHLEPNLRRVTAYLTAE